MFKNLSYKRKNQYLTISFALFLLIAYQLSIAETIELKAELDRARKANQAAIAAPAQLQKIQEKIHTMESLVGSNTQGDNIQQKLLEKLSHYCEKHEIDLTEFPHVKTIQYENYSQHINAFVLKGEFIPLVRLINHFEMEFTLGKITSIDFYSEIDRKTKSKHLYAKIFLQNIEKT